MKSTFSPGLKVLGLAVFSFTSVPQKTPSFVGGTCSVPTPWLTCPLVLISSYALSLLVIIPFPPPPSLPCSDGPARCKAIYSSASSTPPWCPCDVVVQSMTVTSAITLSAVYWLGILPWFDHCGCNAHGTLSSIPTGGRFGTCQMSLRYCPGGVKRSIHCSPSE